MRHALAVASLLTVIAACSSSTEGEACTIVGTYSMTGEVESSTCNFGTSSTSASTSTITVSAAAAGSGSDYIYEIQGAQGSCPLTKVEACKLQGKCPFTVTDATTANNQGTIQATWTFDAKGFSGFSALSLPPFKDNPNGCNQNAKNAATRR